MRPTADDIAFALWGEIAKRCGRWCFGAENVIRKQIARELRAAERRGREEAQRKAAQNK